MNKPSRLLFPILGLLLLAVPVSAQQPKSEPLADKVKAAIARGIGYLRQTQRPDGSWEIDKIALAMEGGQSCLAMLGLFNAGVPADDKMMMAGLQYVRGLQVNTTYVRALQTMVLAEAGQAVDREKIKQNVDWLIDARVESNGQLQGWTYSKGGAAAGTDNSNTQYAMLGLLAGRQAGVKIAPAVWRSIRDYYIRTQEEDSIKIGERKLNLGSGWSYNPGRGTLGVTPHGSGTTLTMTTAGLSGLLIAGVELNEGREVLQPDGTRLYCGVYKENEPAAKALRWIEQHFTLQLGRDAGTLGRTFYNLYGIERAGRLSGLRFFGEHDWYREGCLFLVEKQLPDGSWSLPGLYDRWNVVSTGFSLLFLSKGRTPVLISVLVHGSSWPRQENDTDWNNDRNAARNLTQFVSTHLFKKKTLAWQVFDLMKAVESEKGAITDAALTAITSEMLQSPIFYLYGHKSPRLRLRDVEKDLLKRYVENGGFIVAEACCGRKEFDQGFHELVRELWPDNDLIDLPADHPVWRAFFPVPPGSFKLKGLQMGCKTVLIYSPQDMSCLWEANAAESGPGQLAFRMGTNIVAYATGIEPPLPRLTEIQVASNKDDKRDIPRGYIKAAQIKHGGDWQPAPRAMRNLMAHVHKLAGLDVALQTETMPVYHQDLINFKFLYMHGRGKFQFPSADLNKLEFNLKTGGLLLADACCGNPAFDASFRTLVQQLFPDKKLERVPLDDILFSQELSGEALTAKTIRIRRERGTEFTSAAPFLEGIKIDDRWVILYSKYDIGCALERHQSSDCLGYDHASALKIGTAALLYLLRP